MTGQWGVYRRGERWRRSPRRAWLVIRTEQHEVVEFDGPVLELMTEARTRFDRRLATLGPDLLADDFDERRFLALLRADDRSRGVGEALLDQRNLAGVGNMWKAEGCFLAGIDPWRRLRDLSDGEAVAVVRALRPLMQASADGRRGRRWVYDRAGLPCRRCQTPIRARGQGDDNRTTYWCPAMPGLIRVGHKGADHVAPGNTIESFEAALEHGVDMIEFDVLRTRDGRLVLAHDYEDAGSRECLTLDEGLDHFAGAAYSGVELDVDMKLPGYEREVAEGLAAARARGPLAGVVDVSREPRSPG